MIRRHWRNPHSSQEGYYGLGIISGTQAGWDWFGHSGGLQGYTSRTCVLPACGVTICVLTNATDGWAGYWMDGVISILRTFAARGVPTRRVRDWSGRWWSAWGALDLVPMGSIVVGASPHAGNPFLDATELEVTGRDSGRIRLSGGYQSHGELVRRTRNKNGAVTELWWSASRLRPERRVAAELERQYGVAGKRRRGSAHRGGS